MPNSPRIPNDTWSNNNFFVIIMIGRVTVTQETSYNAKLLCSSIVLPLYPFPALRCDVDKHSFHS
jgi:hypothetical protein